MPPELRCLSCFQSSWNILSPSPSLFCPAIADPGLCRTEASVCPEGLGSSTWHNPSPGDRRCDRLVEIAQAEAQQAARPAHWLFPTEDSTAAGERHILLGGPLAAQPDLAWCHWALMPTAVPITGLHDTEFCFSLASAICRLQKDCLLPFFEVESLALPLGFPTRPSALSFPSLRSGAGSEACAFRMHHQVGPISLSSSSALLLSEAKSGQKEANTPAP